MEDCVFCKIAKGEIPCHKVYEDNDFLAFLSIQPLSRGHTIVIPKKHVRWINELEPSTGIWRVAHEAGRSLVKNMGYDHVNFITLGYEVKHGHIHVIPRNPNDDLSNHIDWSKHKKFSDKEMEVTAERIKI